MPTMQLTQIVLDETGLQTRDGHKLRGYLGSRFAEHGLLHNHRGDGAFRYRYPLVQYKITRGRALILGIGRGGEALEALFLQLNALRIGEREIPLREKQIRHRETVFGWTAKPIEYRFETPWLGLNQKNHERWPNLSEAERAELLERVLTGNLLSLAKGLDYRLAKEQRLVAHARLKPVPVHFKNKPMLGFTGNFSVNFLIPDWLGLGKSCARGFGTVRRALPRESRP